MVNNNTITATQLFETKSLFDVMEYSRIFEYFLLLQDFESIENWRKKVKKGFKHLIYTIFSQEYEKANAICKINSKIFKASSCDEKIYRYMNKRNYSEVEKYSTLKGELLEQALEMSDKLFPDHSLVSSYIRIHLISYYQELDLNDKLSKKQKYRWEIVEKDYDANKFVVKKMQVIILSAAFFNLSNEPKFLNNILNENSDNGWVGSLNLKNYFELQEVFTELRNIKKTKEELHNFLKYLLNGNLCYAVIDLFIKAANDFKMFERPKLN